MRTSGTGVAWSNQRALFLRPKNIDNMENNIKQIKIQQIGGPAVSIILHKKELAMTWIMKCCLYGNAPYTGCDVFCASDLYPNLNTFYSIG